VGTVHYCTTNFHFTTYPHVIQAIAMFLGTDPGLWVRVATQVQMKAQERESIEAAEPRGKKIPTLVGSADERLLTAVYAMVALIWRKVGQ
jgi:hypothetical protein